VEVVALVAVEAVAGGIDVDVGLGMALAVQLDVGLRNAGVVLAEVEHHRRIQLFVQERHGARAVIADRRHRQAGVGQIGHGAAPAVADHADLAVFLQLGGGGLHVFQRALEAQLLH